ncbi:MAG: hypothetical protein CL916_08015 [Deltaproteobacteria bacterium]|nr:hypothetical protein [Deltaproteobacteria bacterium]
MIFGILVFGCSKEIVQPKENKEQTKEAVPLISKHVEGKIPVIQIEEVREKHLEIMLSAYKELNAYYDGVLNTDVQRVRFVGRTSPWKPQTDGQYCIDALSADSSQTEHIYYFANYCRSLSTLLRETNNILYSYINIQTCTDLCSCVMEKGLRLKTRIDKKNVDCLTYCESLGWEVTCSTSGQDLKNKCCAQ